MKGMDPPTPMSTGGRPQARARAHLPALAAGESPAALKAGPVSSTDASTRAPKGAFSSRCLTRAWAASPGSWPGATLRESRTVQAGMRVLEASAVLVTSIPMTVSDGWVHRREAIDPRPVSRTPSSRPVSARRSSSAYSAVASS